MVKWIFIFTLLTINCATFGSAVPNEKEKLNTESLITISESKTTTSGIYIAWITDASQTEDISSFVIHWKSNSLPQLETPGSAKVPGDKNDYLISQLRAETSYSIWVEGMGNDGTVVSSEIVVIPTDDYGLAIESLWPSETWITVLWNHTEKTYFGSYLVNWKVNGENYTATVKNSDANNYIIYHLEPGSTVYVWIVGQNRYYHNFTYSQVETTQTLNESTISLDVAGVSPFAIISQWESMSEEDQYYVFWANKKNPSYAVGHSYSLNRDNYSIGGLAENSQTLQEMTEYIIWVVGEKGNSTTSSAQERAVTFKESSYDITDFAVRSLHYGCLSIEFSVNEPIREIAGFKYFEISILNYNATETGYFLPHDLIKYYEHTICEGIAEGEMYHVFVTGYMDGSHSVTTEAIDIIARSEGTISESHSSHYDLYDDIREVLYQIDNGLYNGFRKTIISNMKTNATRLLKSTKDDGALSLLQPMQEGMLAQSDLLGQMYFCTSPTSYSCRWTVMILKLIKKAADDTTMGFLNDVIYNRLVHLGSELNTLTLQYDEEIYGEAFYAYKDHVWTRVHDSIDVVDYRYDLLEKNTTNSKVFVITMVCVFGICFIVLVGALCYYIISQIQDGKITIVVTAGDQKVESSKRRRKLLGFL